MRLNHLLLLACLTLAALLAYSGHLEVARLACEACPEHHRMMEEDRERVARHRA
jgi:hypothetical protein